MVADNFTLLFLFTCHFLRERIFCFYHSTNKLGIKQYASSRSRQTSSFQVTAVRFSNSVNPETTHDFPVHTSPVKPGALSISRRKFSGNTLNARFFPEQMFCRCHCFSV
jgi:hypothetical protein